jgi:sigma-B regulation protein RsbU (phosphoserine phosphatase)
MTAQPIHVKRPLLWKLVIWIGIPLIIVYGLVLAYNMVTGRQNALRNTQRYLTELTAHHAAVLDGEFREIANSSNALAHILETSKAITEEDIYTLAQRYMEQDADNIAVGVSFEPWAYNSKRKFVSPFIFRSGDGFARKDISQTYNYLNEDWYRIPKMLDEPYWTEPFFGKVSQSLLTTFTTPFHRDGAVSGVAYADLSLAGLDARMRNINIMGGYTFIISRHGTFIYHPDEALIMRQSIFSLAEEYNMPHLRDEGRKMIAGQSGITPIRDFHTGEKKWMVYTAIPSTGWSFAAVIPEEVIHAGINEQVMRQLTIMVLGLLVILLVIIWTAFGITRPVSKLMGMASELADGNLEVQLDGIKGKDEIHELAQSFNAMVVDLKHYIHDLTSVTKAQEAVESELRIARQIQESLLPRIFPPFPDREEFGLLARNIPAKEVAGDFYDFFFLDTNQLALIIADVSGKGISAGLFMAVTRTLLKTVCQKGVRPGDALERANAILCQDNDACMFTTLFLGIYDVQTGRMTYANAGHNTPVIVHPDGSHDELAHYNDMALGIFEEQMYHEASVDIQSNDTLVMYTDGVTEATSPQKELYGEERLFSLLGHYTHAPLSTLLNELDNSLQEFQQGNQFDDITLLILRRNN